MPIRRYACATTCQPTAAEQQVWNVAQGNYVQLAVPHVDLILHADFE